MAAATPGRLVAPAASILASRRQSVIALFSALVARRALEPFQVERRGQRQPAGKNTLEAGVPDGPDC